MSGVSKHSMRLEGKISGVIDGDSRLRAFEDWIAIDDWSWGLTQQSPQQGGQTQAVPTPITFGKTTDRASTKMLNAMARGEKLTAIIALEETAAEQFSLEIVLNEVQILDYSLEVKDSDKGNEATENWKFDYRDISFVVRGAGEQGERVTTLFRPVWASKESPAGGVERTKKEMLKLAENLTPQVLEGIWEQIKQNWKNPNQGGGSDGS